MAGPISPLREPSPLTFSEHSHVAYQPPPPALGWGQLVNVFFSKHGHVVYQITCTHKCSNMVANISFADTYLSHPLTQGMGSNGQNLTFSEHSHVAYQIKENQV